MSQTPLKVGDPAEEYKLGWLAINKLINQGFSWSGHERNCVFLNTRGPAFADVSSVTGLDFDDDGRSVASVDWDFDGDLDLFVTNRTGPRLRFLRNRLDHNGGGFLQLKLEGKSCNRDAIGARVEVLLQDPLAAPLLRTRRAGDGYQAQSSGWMHFGLGSVAVQGVKVSWPDGKEEVFTGVQADARFRLVQGSGKAAVWTPPVAPQNLSPSVPQSPSARSAARVVLANPVPMPQIEVESSDGRSGSLFGVEARIRPQSRGRKPVLLQLWASWCAPCVGELAAFTAAATELRAAGVEILALNIEAESAREDAVKMLGRLGWPHPMGFASAKTVEVLDALQGSLLRQDIRIPVPSSFLVDGNGNLVAFYLGSVTPAQVMQDLQLLSLDATQRLTAALPFPGRWFGKLPTQVPSFLERSFRERGLPATAREYQPGWIHLQFGRALIAQGRLPLAEEQFRLAVAIGPYLAEANTGLGQVLLLQDRPIEAVSAYRRVLVIHPNDEGTLFNLGLAHLALKDYPATRMQIKRLSALGSNFATELETRLQTLEGRKK